MDTAAKTQIVERIKQANNILVTVSNDPSVDQLAACIGLTLLLNRMDKHATAVFSGKVPSTLEFLQPAKTIEANTDSLRDFIISLDKNKADKLRYKVEDQVVRIFITPYKTSLSDADLVFSQGDFNVEVVVALGIKDKSQIDAAITAHGRILHDATTISLNVGPGKAPNLGQINWQEETASSLCEMLVSISEAFGAGLIDNQMATAFLTGIVAETNRFSNAKTSPKVMTMSAQLMAAGANQQLIVSKLEPPTTAQTPKLSTAPKFAAPVEGTLNVVHDNPAIQAKTAPVLKKDTPKSQTQLASDEIHIDAQGNLTTADTPATPAAPPSGTVVTGSAQLPLPPQSGAIPDSDMPGAHTLLDPNSRQPVLDSPFTSETTPEWNSPDSNKQMDPLSGKASADNNLFGHAKTVNPPGTAPAEATASLPPVDSARNAVNAAIAAAPFDPAFANPVQALNAQTIDMSESATADAPKAAPPSMPPPLTLPTGPVVPAAPSSTKPPA